MRTGMHYLKGATALFRIVAAGVDTGHRPAGEGRHMGG